MSSDHGSSLVVQRGKREYQAVFVLLCSGLKLISSKSKKLVLTASAVFFNVGVVQMSVVDDATLVLSVG